MSRGKLRQLDESARDLGLMFVAGQDERGVLIGDGGLLHGVPGVQISQDCLKFSVIGWAADALQQMLEQLALNEQLFPGILARFRIGRQADE